MSDDKGKHPLSDETKSKRSDRKIDPNAWRYDTYFRREQYKRLKSLPYAFACFLGLGILIFGVFLSRYPEPDPDYTWTQIFIGFALYFIVVGGLLRWSLSFTRQLKQSPRTLTNQDMPTTQKKKNNVDEIDTREGTIRIIQLYDAHNKYIPTDNDRETQRRSRFHDGAYPYGVDIGRVAIHIDGVDVHSQNPYFARDLKDGGKYRITYKPIGDLYGQFISAEEL